MLDILIFIKFINVRMFISVFFNYRNCDKWKRAFPGGARSIEEKTQMQVLRDTITHATTGNIHVFIVLYKT